MGKTQSSVRQLTSSEINILSEIYGNNLDLKKIKITRQHLFSFLLRRFTAVTFGNKIAYSRKRYADNFADKDYAMSVLVHEVCHVWQHQKLRYHWVLAMIEQIRFGKRVYDYDIYKHPKLTDFRFEQQGKIMEEYYRMKLANHKDLAVYEKLVYAVL